MSRSYVLKYCVCVVENDCSGSKAFELNDIPELRPILHRQYVVVSALSGTECEMCCDYCAIVWLSEQFIL